LTTRPQNLNHEGHKVPRSSLFSGFPSWTFVPFVVDVLAK
jgi:hypothetical protein